MFCKSYLFKEKNWFVHSHSKTLADLSVWEPKTFEALARVSREKAAENGSKMHEKALDNDVYFYNDEKAEKEAKEKKA